MKRRGVILLREILVTQMNFWAFFPVILTIFAFAGALPEQRLPLGVCCLFLSLLPFALFFVRLYVQNPMLFMIVHAVIVILLYLLPGGNTLLRPVSVILGTGFIVYSLYLRLRYAAWEDRGMTPLGCVLIASGCFFFLQNMGKARWRGLIGAVLILVLCLYFLVYYIESYLNFLLVNEGCTGQIPEREIFLSGIRLAGGYTLCGAVLLFMTSGITWLAGALRLLRQAFVSIIGAVLQLFSFENKVEEASNAVLNRTENQAFLPIEGDAFWLWDVLAYGMLLLIAVGMLYALCKGIGYAILYLQGHWGERAQESETVPAPDSPDVRERLYPDGKGRKTLRRFWGVLSVNERVRRLYRRQALQLGIHPARLRRMTARECAGRMDNPLLAQIYEKARYSGLECTPADLRQMKASCKNQGGRRRGA